MDKGESRQRPLPVINPPPGEEGKENFQDAQPEDAHSELAAPVLTRSREDLAQPMMTRSTEEFRQHQNQDLNVPPLSTTLRRESTTEPMMTHSTEDIRNHATSQFNKHTHGNHSATTHSHPTIPHKSERLRGYPT